MEKLIPTENELVPREDTAAEHKERKMSGTLEKVIILSLLLWYSEEEVPRRVKFQYLNFKGRKFDKPRGNGNPEGEKCPERMGNSTKKDLESTRLPNRKEKKGEI